MEHEDAARFLALGYSWVQPHSCSEAKGFVGRNVLPKSDPRIGRDNLAPSGVAPY